MLVSGKRQLIYQFMSFKFVLQFRELLFSGLRGTLFSLGGWNVFMQGIPNIECYMLKLIYKITSEGLVLQSG